MKQKSLKRLIINQFIKFRRFQNRYTMVQFIKKHWFYIGLAILAMVYFRKEIKAYVGPNGTPVPEKFTQTPDSEAGGQSLFNIGQETKASGVATIMPDVPEADAKAFLRRFAKVAQGEYQKYKIPSSALLALAYVNSHGGTRSLATEGNNYFARICGGNWDGSNMDIGGTCYRRYDKAWDCFRDASSQLSATRWAQALIQNKDTKWEQWIKAFADNEYSDVKNAKEEMIKVVKAYRLFELDGV
jgi:Mannosyl-glycoprotein endo-beta-N-acetylglucosaminidase